MGEEEAELTKGSIPDLRNRFVKGTDLAGIGTAGGNAEINLDHDHTISSTELSHTHTVGGHSHFIAADGSHHHSFVGGYFLVSRKNALIDDPFWLEGEDPDSKTIERHINDKQSLFLFNGEDEFEALDLSPKGAVMDNAGTHNHGGFTAASGSFQTSDRNSTNPGGPNITTQTALEGVNVEPPFFGLVYIMRVR